MALRLFIAIDLPPEWKAALAEIQERLRPHAPRGPRWTRPEGLHLTLKFLGDVDGSRVPALRDAVVRAATERRPFDLRLGAVGSFGPLARPRVLWLGIGGDLAALTALWRSVDAATAPLGFATERGRFSPHLTLARIPDTAPPGAGAALLDAGARVAVSDCPPMVVERIVLMQSELGGAGARYTPLAHGNLREK